MSGIACAKCHKFFRVKKIGVFFEEGMPVSDPDASKPEPRVWTSYKLWAADLLECPACGAELVITGPGQQPVAEHYQPDYVETVAKYSPLFRVDDDGGKRP